LYQWDFEALWMYRPLFARGLGVSLLFTAVVIAMGLVVGLSAGMARLSPIAPVRWIARAYVEVFRCTPVLVQLIWFFYALPMLINVEMSATTAAALALSLYGGSFYAEILRGGIVSIDPGQTEAGAALGMTPAQVMKRVVLPQAFKRMVPPLMNQSILQFKNTSLLSTLAIADLVYQGQIVAHDTFRPLEAYTLIAGIYFAVLFPMTILVQRLERKLAVSN
jgi:polar amino acid transport system permease protein